MFYQPQKSNLRTFSTTSSLDPTRTALVTCRLLRRSLPSKMTHFQPEETIGATYTDMTSKTAEMKGC